MEIGEQVPHKATSYLRKKTYKSYLNFRVLIIKALISFIIDNYETFDDTCCACPVIL